MNIMKTFFCILFYIIIVFISSNVSANDEPMIELAVVRNDYLFKLCEKYLDDQRHCMKIAKINHLTDINLIYPGQVLLVPVKFMKGTPMEGKVTFIKGDVTMQEREGDTWDPANLNDYVKEGSRIKTGDESAVEVTFEDGSSFFLRSNSTIGLSTARKKGTSHILRRIFLLEGRVITKIKRDTGTESRDEIQTHSAVAAAKGTEFRASVDSEATTRTEVLQGVVTMTAERQEALVKEGEGTLAEKGKPPVAPRKLLPPPALLDMEPLYRAMPLKFGFEMVPDAVRYRVMLARDSAFKDVIKEKIIEPDQTLDIVGVDDGLYYIQALSIDALDIEGIPGAPTTIKVRVNPLPPFIESPVDSAEYRKKNVRLSWLKVTDAVKYHVQIAEAPDFSAIVTDKNDLAENEYATEVPDFRTYYFRMGSIASDGYEGIWSDTIRFTVVPPPPAPPVEKPEMNEKEINIRWRNLGEGMTYHFQMAGDPGFTDMLMDAWTEKPETTIKKPAGPGTYFVRISGIDAEGYEGGFSPAQSFEIKKRFPFEVVGIVGAIGLFLLLTF